VGKGFTFDVTAGLVEQTLRLYVNTFNATGTLTATLKDSGDATLGTPVADTASSSTIFEVTFSDPDAETLTIDWVNTTDSGNFDNVQLFAATMTIVPEPTSLALLFLGGVALLGRRRS
jgi:hypothetical protein